MSDFLSELRKKQYFACYGPVTNEEIKAAEEKLGTKFSPEYREYALACGFASVTGHEFTGICPAKRMNVVDVTLNERKNNPDIPAELYVIEQTDVEEIVIWQSGNGQVFCSSPNQGLTQLCNSLADYISK